MGPYQSSSSRTHKVEIVSIFDRSTPICSCGKMPYRQFFGDRRTANAKSHIFRHLESAEGFDTDGSPEFQIKDSDPLKCPICKEGLDLSKDDLGLFSDKSPCVINCKDGHEFDAYHVNKTLFLWFDGIDAHTPFWKN